MSKLSLSAQVKQACLSKHFRLAVAESLTAGHLQALITSVPGASGYFEGGITAYNLEQKVCFLKVDEDRAREVNCVSQDIAVQMAERVLHLFNATVAIATTGYAEPDPSRDIPTPYAYVAVSNGIWYAWKRITPPFGMKRLQVQRFVAEEALKLFLKETDALRFSGLCAV